MKLYMLHIIYKDFSILSFYLIVKRGLIDSTGIRKEFWKNTSFIMNTSPDQYDQS